MTTASPLHDADREAARERADRLTEAAFPAGRCQRSPEYISGVRTRLRFSLAGDSISNPYPAGTSDADALWAGCEEGRLIARMQG